MMAEHPAPPARRRHATIAGTARVSSRVAADLADGRPRLGIAADHSVRRRA